jgi:hypothetical protein
MSTLAPHNDGEWSFFHTKQLVFFVLVLLLLLQEKRLFLHRRDRLWFHILIVVLAAALKKPKKKKKKKDPKGMKLSSKRVLGSIETMKSMVNKAELHYLSDIFSSFLL